MGTSSGANGRYNNDNKHGISMPQGGSRTNPNGCPNLSSIGDKTAGIFFLSLSDD